MDVEQFKSKQQDKADSLAEVLGEFNAADAEYRARTKEWTAEDGEPGYEEQESAVTQANAERSLAARKILRVAENFAGIRYEVQQVAP